MKITCANSTSTQSVHKRINKEETNINGSIFSSKHKHPFSILTTLIDIKTSFSKFDKNSNFNQKIKRLANTNSTHKYKTEQQNKLTNQIQQIYIKQNKKRTINRKQKVT